MQALQVKPIGWILSGVKRDRDDSWKEVSAEIRLDESQFGPESLSGLAEFSHVEVLFLFDQLSESEVESKTRHPRENVKWPKVGIFAQRGRKRPNRIGATICELLGVDGASIRVRGLDAFDGSPVLDIKPVMAEFLPEKGSVRQPRWSSELMSTYF